jgi:periplasmic divalent cation tolerance protein
MSGGRKDAPRVASRLDGGVCHSEALRGAVPPVRRASPARLTPQVAWSRFLGAMGAIVVVTTVGTEDQANSIARELVARRQAASVNIVSGVRSVYRWKGKICIDGELTLFIKTQSSEFEAVAATIRELHNYELPEILAFAVTRGEDDFLAWIAQNVDKDAVFPDDEEDDDARFDDD